MGVECLIDYFFLHFVNPMRQQPKKRQVRKVAVGDHTTFFLPTGVSHILADSHIRAACGIKCCHEVLNEVWLLDQCFLVESDNKRKSDHMMNIFVIA